MSRISAKEETRICPENEEIVTFFHCLKRACALKSCLQCFKNYIDKAVLIKEKKDLFCMKCRYPVKWAKFKFIRPDGYPDWRLDVWCDCGPIRNPEIISAVRRDHDDIVTDEIDQMMRNGMGRSLYDALEGMDDSAPVHVGR